MNKQALVVVWLLLWVLWGTSCSKQKNPLGPSDGKPPAIPATMPQTDIPWPSLAKSPWPMVHHDPQLTGRSPYQGAKDGELVWASNIPELGRTRTGVVIGTDGTLYYGAEGGGYSGTVLVALNSDGTEKWRYGIGFVGELWSTPLIGSDETIYIGSLDHHLYAINPNGTLKWKFNAAGKIYQGINIGVDGTLYFVAEDSSLYAVNPQGQLVWKLKVDEGFQPYWSDAVTISPDGLTLYVPGISKNLYAIETRGDLKWKFATDFMFDDPLVDSQGNIYGTMALSEKCTILCAINPDGNLRWSRAFPSSLLP
ncbi:MAG: PQQ-binding-like beta-propeller repeat protein, partial [candidate division KSB1 bacterium]|nr:PQQ-binding-like beta-propeller repeat protein [candidate division KSB1 bacterium]